MYSANAQVQICLKMDFIFLFCKSVLLYFIVKWQILCAKIEITFEYELVALFGETEKKKTGDNIFRDTVPWTQLLVRIQ